MPIKNPSPQESGKLPSLAPPCPPSASASGALQRERLGGAEQVTPSRDEATFSAPMLASFARELEVSMDGVPRKTPPMRNDRAPT
jgi:hypothetical protein